MKSLSFLLTSYATGAGGVEVSAVRASQSRLGLSSVLHQAPALLPAAAAWLGAAIGTVSRSRSVSLWLLVLVLALILRRRGGWTLAAMAAGVLLSYGGGEQLCSLPELDRPVKVTVRVSEAWVHDGYGWSGRGRAIRWQQGLRVENSHLSIRLLLPTDIDPPPPGSLVRLRGYLVRSAGYANSPATPPGPWRIRVKSLHFMEILERPSVGWRFGASLRRRVHRLLLQLPSGKATAFARALLLGDTRQIPDQTLRGLRRWGLAHLTAVSGLHLGLAMAPVWWLLPSSDRRLRILLSLAVVAFYLLLVGPRPSLLRAAAMAMFGLLGAWNERPFAAIHGLALAVLCLLAFDPLISLDLGFGLSVSATFGLFLLAPVLIRAWAESGFGGRLTKAFAASSSAWLATLPWAASHFHLVVPASPFLNLFFVPWVGVALPLLACWIGIGICFPLLATTLTPIMDVLVAPASWPGLLPPVHGLSESVSWSAAQALLVALMIGFWLFRPTWTRSACLAAALTVLAVEPPEGARIAVIDIGQGDATLLDDGEGAVLVDTGGWSRPGLASKVLVPALTGLGVRRLDAVLITHGDRDHCGALAALVDLIPVAAIWTTEEVRRSSCLRGIGRRSRWEALVSGDRRRIGGWQLQVLHPPRDHHLKENDASLVLLAERRGRRILLTGDIEERAEAQLVARYGRALDAEILKVAHHGSQTSSSRALLDAVQPRLALVSAGVDNRYGHPSQSVLDRLAERNVGVLRTDRSGLIVLHLLDRGGIRIATPGAPR